MCNIRTELQRTEWRPLFTWVSSIPVAADAINRPHEDYPARVEATAAELERLGTVTLTDSIPNDLLCTIHRAVFVDADFAGKWKELDVQLDPNGPTRIMKVADLMRRLEAEYTGRITDLETLREWFLDFEAIHPFPDGNGRTGGIILAAYSHQMFPNRGWLTARQ